LIFFFSLDFGPAQLPGPGHSTVSPVPASPAQPATPLGLCLLAGPACLTSSLLLPHASRVLPPSFGRQRISLAHYPPPMPSREPDWSHPLNFPLLYWPPRPQPLSVTSDHQWCPTTASIQPPPHPLAPIKEHPALPHSTTAAPTLLSSHMSPQRPPHSVSLAAATSHRCSATLVQPGMW
jgi:hypothetical protein